MEDRQNEKAELKNQNYKSSELEIDNEQRKLT